SRVIHGRMDAWRSWRAPGDNVLIPGAAVICHDSDRIREKSWQAWHHVLEGATRQPMPLIDADLLGRLYRQHAPALRLFARQWGVNGDDLVQDAFVKLAQQLSPPAQIVGWLYQVVRNGAIAAARTAARRRRREGIASIPEVW